LDAMIELPYGRVPYPLGCRTFACITASGAARPHGPGAQPLATTRAAPSARTCARDERPAALHPAEPRPAPRAAPATSVWSADELPAIVATKCAPADYQAPAARRGQTAIDRLSPRAPSPAPVPNLLLLALPLTQLPPPARSTAGSRSSPGGATTPVDWSTPPTIPRASRPGERRSRRHPAHSVDARRRPAISADLCALSHRGAAALAEVDLVDRSDQGLARGRPTRRARFWERL
jgi:hypothetical protein